MKVSVGYAVFQNSMLAAETHQEDNLDKLF